MKILVTGKGGREHALVTALAESTSRPELFACPGSDAIGELATRVDVPDLDALIAWMQQEQIDLCVAGEEAWLAQGLADQCLAAGIRVWGPVQEAAQLETSKKYAKEFMARHHIPTAEFRIVNSAEELEAAIERLPVVLKYDGLAAGKGVSVCFNQLQVEDFKRRVFTDKAFGDGEVVVEQFLDGNELSVICAVMDQEVLVFTPARDYKRQLAGDNGPNTGGMGAVASRALIDSDWMARIENEVIRPTIQGLRKDGLSYHGFLYFGCMLTRKGPELLEYNCRFGDPEAQAILPLVSGDFAGFLYDAAGGTWNPKHIEFNNDWSMCLVFASGTYPASGDSGKTITGLENTAPLRVYHAGTRRNGSGAYETNGGRILALAHRAGSLETLRDEIYEAAQSVQFEHAQFRPDIGYMHFENGLLVTPEDA